MKTKVFRVVSLALLIAWCVLIFALSAEPADKSSNTSGELTRAVFSLVYPDFEALSEQAQEQMISEASFIVRKAAHFSLYFVLGALAFLSIATYNIPFLIKPLASAAFSLGFSISDEIHQLYVPGRSGEIRDVIIDFCGSVLAVLILSFIFAVKENGGGKMRKKELIKLNEQLFDRAENAMKEAEELKSENLLLKEKIAELENEIVELSAKAEEAPAEEEAIIEEVPIIEIAPINEAPASPPLKKLEEKLMEQVKLNEETEYGAAVIGKIVVSATKYCNELSTSLDNGDAKELVNLILGRTEVAKAEILNIVAGACSIEVKKAMIDSERAQAEDYFKSVMAQK